MDSNSLGPERVVNGGDALATTAVVARVILSVMVVADGRGEALTLLAPVDRSLVVAGCKEVTVGIGVEGFPRDPTVKSKQRRGNDIRRITRPL